MRLIDAETLADKFREEYIKTDCTYTQPFICASLILLEKFIKAAPTVEAKPVVHAHWEIEYDDDDNIKKCYCSNCGVGCEPMNYCGFCGAQMDEVVSDTNVGSKGVKIPVISMEDVAKLAKEMEK